jgi:hypothetical protein
MPSSTASADVSNPIRMFSLPYEGTAVHGGLYLVDTGLRRKADSGRNFGQGMSEWLTA